MFLPVLINSCDKFRDCWDPFFILWKKFGIKKISCPLYLNTERADYSMEGLEIHTCRVCEKNHWQEKNFPSWSWCTRKAVEQIEGDFFLYMQEDYFLDRPVDDDAVIRLLEMMQANPDIHNIHLTDQGIGDFIPSDIEGLKKGDPRRSCYASLQAVIWRKDVFLSLLRDWEDAWQFEAWATKRSRVRGLNYYVPESGDHMPMYYVFTGVIQGKWYAPCVPLFAEHGIQVDFDKRGMYDGPCGKREGRFFAYWKMRIKLILRGKKRHFLPLKSMIEYIRMSLA